ncbi:MAG: hypothetical protein CME99_12335 [Hyphomonas sp.]|uniref:DUF2065 domain-containing protein n=1 Tax=Hyphomonas atlantica TaxID=1280948 RepID=A0A356W9B8_9PROT|nr:hypothetical protein [Hyphomonas sp.]OUX83530.1 MAG: hypothetical protein CBB91_11910 [Hyphomonas sp. TMED31]HBF91256.1 hypothetical protein [Hyphomonas atlantica]MAH93948.1 hypothetical protein [Hyphomonas sp.]HBH44966.1 hypothetical protein [Hyphomonas atlantica]HBQ50260.1 hypothetical protein [Hyphomonas atlantica]|tara:strand:+ start:80 stop:460 length:381 start_codon:yes stop_codon:yes gene_type:complete
MLTDTILLLFGLYFMAAGAGLLTDPLRVAKMIDDLEASPAIGFLCGAVMLFSAGGTLSLQNSFTNISDGLATLLLAGALIEGLLLVAWPKPIWAIAHWMMPDDDHLRGFGVVALAIGAVVFALGAL